jgi:hypothetical protein
LPYYSLIFALPNKAKPKSMKNKKEGNSPKAKTSIIDPEANEKRKRRLEVQKDVLRKIIDPLKKEIQEEELKEAVIKLKRK